jgi:eukaryotic-like serine/threonine-protein kinase
MRRPARILAQGRATIEIAERDTLDGGLEVVTNATEPDPVPSAVGRYEILRELGRGAMGVVYEARDPALSRTIALKTILAAPPGEKEPFEERFFSEARIAARLSHPGIVVVHDVGRDAASGTLYIALEHLHGRTLAEIAEEGPMDWREVCRLGAQIARALHHAHAQGVVHCDMKPANVMLLPSGETKIMDFGIAWIETARFHRSKTGEFVGTPLYAAPEQASTGKVDARTDVFSLGTIAYTLLAGRPAFAAGSIPRIVERVLRHDPPPPSSVVPGIPVYLDRVIARAMAKEPSHRYPDALVLADDLEAVLAGRLPSHASEAARIAAVATWPLPRTEAAIEPVEMELVEAPEDPLESALHALVEGAPEPQEAGVGQAPSAPPGAESVPAPEASLTSATTIPVARVPGRRRRAALVGGMLLLAGFAIGYLALRLRDAALESGTPDPPAPPTLAAPLPPPAAVPSPVAAEPTPKPTASAARVQPSARTAVPVPAAGRLRIDFDHPLKAGDLRVWVDGAQVIHERISGTVRKKAVVFKLAQGKFRETLEVSPGVHIVRFQIAWGDNVKAEEITGTFAPGETKTLAADLGRLRKDLDLAWK